ncbi:4-hydroxythreonine-4-phosphate dehydrogenase [Monaibacterium marinum]|uniref:4-hydroxythreonine-4-phosphate dehydrogenase n=1 Tax=Pontivivens marinum TaxID=1690039 RepID=A0A2C9CR08_9RHOB|nr:4-hydroxythreonine-4-phosphate dehydrogenase PdxA [Monaibacterium marinum]SOH93660.1 4-hydroxythreonine-4-phosphate dehydrogenase [Monaibacterium marinum]
MLALTLGDPAGVGPELAAAAWRRKTHRFLAIGSADILRRFDVPAVAVASVRDAQGNIDALPVLNIPTSAEVNFGTPDPRNASGVIEAITQGARLAQSGQVSALVTAPISKKILKDGGGFAHPGHTEFLAHLSGAPRPVMMLAGPDLRVVPVTIHIPLADVPQALTAELLEETIRVTDAGLRRDLGITSPRIAIAGLNPHAGEGGVMGRQEIELLMPVLTKLRAQGFNLTDPMPADTMFHAAARQNYDVAICMYHDQALIPLKTLSFDDGVNVTLGLPFIRTSPDHGTAFDIAGKNIARPDSLFAAMDMATLMAERRK